MGAASRSHLSLARRPSSRASARREFGGLALFAVSVLWGIREAASSPTPTTTGVVVDREEHHQQRSHRHALDGWRWRRSGDASTARRAENDDGSESATQASSSSSSAAARFITGGVDRRHHSDEFMAFVRRFGKAKAYCPDDVGGFPCQESARREAVFVENMADLAALGASQDGGGSTPGAPLGDAASRSARPRVFFRPSVYSDVEKGAFRARFTNLKPMPENERTRSKAKHKSWIELHKLFLRRNKDLWGDRRPAPADQDLYAIDPADIPEQWDWRDKGGVSRVGLTQSGGDEVSCTWRVDMCELIKKKAEIFHPLQSASLLVLSGEVRV